MLTVTESEASRDLARIMEAAQSEPVVIRNGRLGAVLVSTDEYNELKRHLHLSEIRLLCARAGAEAKAAGLTEELLQELLASDD